MLFPKIREKNCALASFLFLTSQLINLMDHVYYRWPWLIYRPTVDQYISHLSVNYRWTTDSRPIYSSTVGQCIGRYVAINYRWSIGKVLVKYWSRVGQVLVRYRSCIVQVPVMYPACIGQVSMVQDCIGRHDYQLTIGQLLVDWWATDVSVDCWPILADSRPIVDR